MDNTQATLHLLTASEAIFFKNKLMDIQEKISKICQESNLDGNWTLSQDCKMLVKVEDK